MNKLLTRSQLLEFVCEDIVSALENSRNIKIGKYTCEYEHYERQNTLPILNNKSIFVSKIDTLSYEIYAYKVQNFDESTDEVLKQKWIAGENKNAGWDKPDWFSIIEKPFCETKL